MHLQSSTCNNLRCRALCPGLIIQCRTLHCKLQIQCWDLHCRALHSMRGSNLQVTNAMLGSTLQSSAIIALIIQWRALHCKSQIQCWTLHAQPLTQSMMYVPLQANTCQKCILLIVEYRYLKSCSEDFYSPESDPQHKIIRYWDYYSTQLSFGFPPDRICQAEMICIGGAPVLKRHFGGAGP